MLFAAYGTLRKGGSRNSVLKDCPYKGKFKTVNPFVMYDLGAFPGIVEGGKHPVTVEVYDITDDVLATLDMIEGVGSGLYKRINTLIDGPGLAITYVLGDWFNKQEPIIHSGDWFRKGTDRSNTKRVRECLEHLIWMEKSPSHAVHQYLRNIGFTPEEIQEAQRLYIDGD